MDITLEKKLAGYKQIALEKVNIVVTSGCYAINPESNWLLTNFYFQPISNQLENILLQIHGKKDLIIEPDLIRILDSFANMTWLK